MQDSLWAAEDIEAVFDQDPQRVCILQGPVAVKYSTVKDEPIKDLLGNITSCLVEKLLERSYDGDVSKVPTVDYLAPVPEETDTPDGVAYEETAKSVTYIVGDVIPDTKEWLQALSGPELSWLKALLTSDTIVQGTAYIDNPLQRALAPRHGQKVVIGMEKGSPTSLTFYGGGRSHGTHKPDFKAVEIHYTASSKLIDVTFYEDRRDVSVPLALQFKYVPSTGAIPIHEVAVGRNRRIKEFYWKLWFGDDEELPEIDIHETFIGPEVTISAEDVGMFCGVVGNQNEAFKTARTEIVKAPMDFAIVTGWQVCRLSPVSFRP
jgi:fatty acid synthase subunit beta